ncbi:MAG: DUF58 domain-containing protein [Planctomycetota bacterium]
MKHRAAPSQATALPGGFRVARERAWHRVRGGSSSSVQRRFEFTLTGMLYTLVTTLLVFAAVNSQSNLLFLAFGLAIGGLLVGGVLSGAGMMSLTVRRLPPTHATAGEPITVEYSLTDRSRTIAVLGLTLSEVADINAPTGASVTTGWLRSAPRGQTTRVEGRLPPKRRGRHTLACVELASTFPFGIARKAVRFEQHHDLLVLPAEVRVPDDILEHVTAGVHEAERDEASRRGNGDFFALREFSPGDSPSRVAWKRSATLGYPVVPLHGELFERRVTIEAYTAGLSPDAADRVLGAARYACRVLGQRGIDVGLRAGGREVPPSRGPRHEQRLLRLLATADAAKRSRESPADARGLLTLGAATPGAATPGAALPGAASFGRRTGYRVPLNTTQPHAAAMPKGP